MLIIMTATITPANNIKFLSLRNSEERLKQYKESLISLIKSKPNCNIVFCDNSNIQLSMLEDIMQLAEKENVSLELLSFKGDAEGTEKYGKGYGEGEIIKYVLENSKLARNETYMVKITGRLIVHNIFDLTNRLKKNLIYFNVPNYQNRSIYDTRVYAMPICIFKEYFIEGYKNVDDENGYYLENAYTDIILKERLKINNFPKCIRLVGESGSGGAVYTYKEWKARVRDFLCLFNIYGHVKK